MGYNFGSLFGTQDFYFFGGTSLFERSGFGFRFGFRFGTHFEPKSLRKQGRRDKRKRRKLERRKRGLDVAGAIREALEVVWRKSQNRQKEEKKSVPKWEPVLDPALTPKRSRFGAEITCDNDFGWSQVVKKRGPETSTENGSDSIPRPPGSTLQGRG